MVTYDAKPFKSFAIYLLYDNVNLDPHWPYTRLFPSCRRCWLSVQLRRFADGAW